jgi:hypothetical protein
VPGMNDIPACTANTDDPSADRATGRWRVRVAFPRKQPCAASPCCLPHIEVLPSNSSSPACASTLVRWIPPYRWLGGA